MGQDTDERRIKRPRLLRSEDIQLIVGTGADSRVILTKESLIRQIPGLQKKLLESSRHLNRRDLQLEEEKPAEVLFALSYIHHGCNDDDLSAILQDSGVHDKSGSAGDMLFEQAKVWILADKLELPNLQNALLWSMWDLAVTDENYLAGSMKNPAEEPCSVVNGFGGKRLLEIFEKTKSDSNFRSFAAAVEIGFIWNYRKKLQDYSTSEDVFLALLKESMDVTNPKELIDGQCVGEYMVIPRAGPIASE